MKLEPYDGSRNRDHNPRRVPDRLWRFAIIKPSKTLKESWRRCQAKNFPCSRQCIYMSSVNRSREVLSKTNHGEILRCRQLALHKISTLMHAYGPSHDTVAHAITIFERFLVSTTEPNDLKFTICPEEATGYSAACFLIAMKLREQLSPALIDMVQDECSAAQIASCEVKIMTLLQWNVHTTTGNTHILTRNQKKP